MTCWVLLAAFTGLPTLGMAQASNPSVKPTSGGGQSVQHAVKVAFEPIRLDAQGHVIQPVPETKARTNQEVEHVLSAKALAEKALADSHKAPPITKPAPTFLGPGKFPAPPQPAKSGQAPPVKNFSPNPLAQSPGADDPPQTGINFQASTTNIAIPPDVAMAAGPNQVVTASNLWVSIYDKLGNRLGLKILATFYQSLGSLGAISNWFIFDPVVHYDEYIQRFWLVTAARNDSTNQSDVLIGLSNGADATAGWSLFSTDMTLDGTSQTSNWCDYPQLGFDTQAIYITCNMIAFPATSHSPQFGKVRVMAKSQFLKDTCCSYWDHWSKPFTMQPATMHRAKDSDGEFLIDAVGSGQDVQAGGGGGDSGDTLDVWHFPDPIGNPSKLDQATVSVSAYGPAPSAHQPDPNLIDTDDARLLFAIWQDGNLSTGQTTLCNNYSCAAFYELNVSSFPSVSVFNDWALQSAGIDYYYPAVDENRSGDKTMVFTTSAPDQYASAVYVGIPNSKHCVHCISAPQGFLGAGDAAYVNYGLPPPGPTNRWGDYFSASADPDGLGIWIAGEFSVVSPRQPTPYTVQVGATYNTYAPELKISPTAVDFGDKLVSPSWTRDVTLTNSGNADLTIDSIKLDGSSDYSVISDSCRGMPLLPSELLGGLARGVLEAKQSCVITVMFIPTGGGEKKTTLSICDSLKRPCLAPVTVPFTFQGPAITRVSPNNGPLVGELVTVTGDALSDKFTFDFGGSPATYVSCSSLTTCTMVAPSHAPGRWM